MEQNNTAMQQDEQEKRFQPVQLLFDAADLMESVIGSIFVVLLVYAFLFCTANVEGPSMEPTLENGDRLAVSRIDRSYDDGDILILYSGQAYSFNEAGEIVASPGRDENIVKRLIAQAGQEVNIDFSRGKVTVDGTVLDEPYISGPTMQDYGTFQFPITVPEGYVFVLGDNRPISCDSRHPTIGLIPVEDILGKAVLRIAPFSKFGKI